ncbi:MAG: amidohydrolase [Eubacteriales bacterium]|nr:amidohydrolase [Eubacteriales bacterium]MDD4582911.1 amidohydrolase [Eubacteriales bacterium]
MLFSNIIILDENLSVREGMYVGIKGNKIDYVGKEVPKEDYGEIYEGKGRLLMSGFFNSHAHTPMTLMRGYGENMALQSWLNDRIFPFEDKLMGDDVYFATLLGIAESLRYGIVSTTDMYYFCDRMAEAVLESGVKNNLGRGLTSFTDAELWDLQAYRESKYLFEQYNNKGGGRLKVDMSLHAEYTSNPKIVRQFSEFTKELGTRMHVHISETTDEHRDCKERHGKTPVAYFNDLGLLDSKTTAAHCVFVEGEDFDILAEKGVTVATCPVSNLKLASGVCNVPLLLKRQIPVAIGTDSVSSNNSLNYIEEMKFFSLVHKARYEDPTLITPKQTLYAATRAGALGQDRTDTGKLAVGFRADLIVLDISGPNMHPVHDLLNNVVYAASGSDVVLTMVDGRVLYRDGEFKTIDLEKVQYEVEKSRVRIIGEL